MEPNEGISTARNEYMTSHRQLHYHLVWATRFREPWITQDREGFMYAVLGRKVQDLGGFVHAVNGMPDHVHLVADIPPTIAVAQFVGQVKGASSRRYRELVDAFQWQAGYSAFTVSPRQLPHAIAYVTRQKQHHANNTAIRQIEPPPDASRDEEDSSRDDSAREDSSRDDSSDKVSRG
ncbi:MAG: IS200/IS605 family transposase [Acidobacteriota bacterium]